MLREGIRTVKKKGIHHVLETSGRIRRYTPWLGDRLSFLYDRIMEKKIFPKKFNADISLHEAILTEELSGVHGRRVLELAAGSGSAAAFLSADNRYAGTDISPGLLRRARRRFAAAGFEAADFYVAAADDLPFADGIFDVLLCHLALNFFTDLGPVIREARRLLAPAGAFLCSVPVPERLSGKVRIRGVFRSETELAKQFSAQGFRFTSLGHTNGALLYFCATAAASGKKNLTTGLSAE